MAYGKIKFAEGGEIELLANAATKYRFRQIFGLDLIDEFSDMEAITPGRLSELLEMLTYTMKLQAEKAAEKGSIDDFFVWLEGIAANEITEHFDEIFAIYQGNQKTLSETKNPEGPQSGK